MRNERERVERLGGKFTGQVGTGEEAIVVFKKFLPDLILMHLRPPGAISGVDAIARIHSALRRGLVHF